MTSRSQFSSNTSRGGNSFTASSLLNQRESAGFSDPLASTAGYDVDPWSGTQSPVRTPTPRLTGLDAAATAVVSNGARADEEGDSALSALISTSRVH